MTALPPDIEQALERAATDVAKITDWLRATERIDKHVVDGVREWATWIAAQMEGRTVPSRRSIDEIRAEAREERIAAGPSREPRLPGMPPAIGVDKGADRVRLVFEVSGEQFWALEAAGRSEAKAKNVQVVGPARYFGQPRSDELCARWAIQRAISATYPTIAAAPLAALTPEPEEKR